MNRLITILIFSFFSFYSLMAQVQIGADIDGEAAGDRSGLTVAINSAGTRIAVGGYLNDGNGTDAGHVKIYEESGGTWSQVGADINGESAGDESGSRVALNSSGTRVAISAWLNDGNGADAGHVRIYEESGGTWIQVGADIDGEAAGDQSGVSVSMNADGTRVAIGAHYNDGNGNGSGHVRIYEESGGSWSQIGADIDGEAAVDLSGGAVSLNSSGTRVAIGAIYNSGGGSDAGHVRIYEESGGSWTQVGTDLDGEATQDNLGRSVSMNADGTRVAIGANYNDGNGNASGHIRIYEESGGSWTQVGADIDGEAAGDFLGWSVSMNSDGTIVSSGATRNDGNGSNSGHVRVYKESGGSWTQVGTDIDGEATLDQSGIAVSLSSDGTRVAIGANLNDGGGSDAGHVRVYDLTNALPVELTNFYATPKAESVQIKWETASENNNRGFNLQRSKDGINWKDITFVEGAGTANFTQYYEYLDTESYSNLNYYRLKQIDFNGYSEHSEVIVVDKNTADSKISFYPNPTYDIIHLSLPEADQVTIYDTLGRLLDRFYFEEGSYDLELKKYGESILMIRVGEVQTKVMVR